MDHDLLNLLRALGVGAATWLATAAVWVASGLAGDARIRRRRAARLVRRKAASPPVPTFADPGSCRYCGGRHETAEGAEICFEFRHHRRDLMAWSVARRHLEYLKKTETLAS